MKYRFENVKCIKTIDGDTIDVIIDFGFNLTQTHRLRFFGINAPETRGPEREEGLKSKAWLKDLIEGKRIKIQTYKRGKYGRIVADIIFKRRNINKRMVEEGLAEYKEY